MSLGDETEGPHKEQGTWCDPEGVSGCCPRTSARIGPGKEAVMPGCQNFPHFGQFSQKHSRWAMKKTRPKIGSDTDMATDVLCSGPCLQPEVVGSGAQFRGLCFFPSSDSKEEPKNE